MCMCVCGEGWGGRGGGGVPCGKGRVGLAGHQPGGTVVRVPVPFVVHRDDVHQHDVLGVLVHPGERDPDGGEHPPDDAVTRDVRDCIIIVNVGMHFYYPISMPPPHPSPAPTTIYLLHLRGD